MTNLGNVGYWLDDSGPIGINCMTDIHIAHTITHLEKISDAPEYKAKIRELRDEQAIREARRDMADDNDDQL